MIRFARLRVLRSIDLVPGSVVAFGLLLSAALPAFGQTSRPSLTLPKIDRRPAAEDYSRFRKTPTTLPAFDPNSTNPFQMDLRSTDVSGLELRDAAQDLLQATFDTRTRWPAAEQLPPEFDPARILDLGKNPGLGVRALHARGITGRGVGIAIVDQPLLIDHEEFGDRIRLYEEINLLPFTPAQMHGPAVASIAAGKTVGVAPEADIYFIATFAFNAGALQRSDKRDFQWYAQAVRRVLEINEQLPAGKKIRVISLSVGWAPEEAGYKEMEAAARAAAQAGLLVTSSNFDQMYGRGINGLEREPLADPDRFESYAPGGAWARHLANMRPRKDTLLLPMDARTAAAPNGNQDYAFYRHGGWSWITPYLAGVYALAVQVKPEITPEEFLAQAYKTGRPLEAQTKSGRAVVGVIVDPVKLVEGLGAKKTVSGSNAGQERTMKPIRLSAAEIARRSDDDVFKLLGQTLEHSLPDRNDPSFLTEARKLPRGLRAMAVTYELDVSLTLDDLGWHFGNWHDQELAEETAAGLEELGATELAALFRQAFAHAQQYWTELGREDWAEWYHGSELKQSIELLNDRAWALLEEKPNGIFSCWIDYARRYPERVGAP